MRDLLLIFANDGDYAYDITRRLRREGVHCRLAPRTLSAEAVREADPAGLIFAGATDGRAYDAPIDAHLLSLGLPILAMGDSATEVARQLGAAVSPWTEREKESEALRVTYGEHLLFADVEPTDRWFENPERWMLPETLTPVVWVGEENVPVGFASEAERIFGLRFQVERNDPEGLAILMNFALQICDCTAWRTPEVIEEQCRREIRELPPEQSLLCLVSGGLDSAVCARLAEQALGSRASCVWVDTGLMRAGEAEEVRRFYQEEMHLQAAFVDAREDVFAVLAGVLSSTEKAQVVAKVRGEAVCAYAGGLPGVSALVRGTNYTELLSNGVYDLEEPAPLGDLRILEPLRDLLREEVRELGERLNLPEAVLHRQSFPGAGLALRLMGQVSRERVALLRAADAVLREEIAKTGQEKRLSCFFAVLLPASPGQELGEVAVLRALQSSNTEILAARLPYDILEHVTERILDEVPGISHVVYDLTAGDAEKIEWR